MPTMKDIADRAGVSYGTVSNVLNRRGNVSSEKIRLVERAAEELGYTINEKASDLRSNKKEDIAIIIPTLDDFKLRNIYNLLRKKVSLRNTKFNLYITDFNPILEEQYARIATRTNRYIVLNSCLQKPDTLYDSKIFNESILIFINTRINVQKPNLFQINFDSRQLETDILQYIEKHQYNNVLLFADYDFVEDNFINIDTITHIKCSHPFNLSTAIEVLNEKAYDGIIVTSIEKYQSILSAMKILKQPSKQNIMVITADDMAFDHHAHQYHIDLNQIVERLEAIIDNNAKTHRIVLPFSGFLKTFHPNHSQKHIDLLMIESPATSALINIIPYIEQLLGFTINVTVIQYNEYDIIMDKNTIDQYDLIRIDMAYLPEIAEKTFKPLDERFVTLTHRMIPHLDEYTKHRDVFYALPFDIGCQILMYRNDVLNNQRIRREYYEQTRQQEVVPNNYRDYNTLETFIAHHYGDIFKGSTVCTGSSITCGNEFIIRVNHDYILDENNQLNIGDANVRKALESYRQSVQATNTNNRFWDDVIKEYAEGNTVMSIVYSNYIHLIKSYNKELLYKTSFSTPPGEKSLIGGGVIGLSKNTKKDDLCHAFLQTLYSDQISKVLTHLGGTMPSRSIYDDIHLTSMYPWLRFIPNILANNTRKHYRPDGSMVKTIDYEKQIGREVKKHIANELRHDK